MSDCRICDTRIYLDFNDDFIWRDFSVKQNTYQELRDKGFLFTPEFNLSDTASDQLYPVMDTRLHVVEKVMFN